MSTERWSRSARLAEVVRPDRVVLLPLDRLDASTVPVALDGAAASIWTALDRPRTAAELHDSTGLPIADLEVFLEQLADLGLATAVPMR